MLQNFIHVIYNSLQKGGKNMRASELVKRRLKIFFSKKSNCSLVKQFT